MKGMNVRSTVARGSPGRECDFMDSRFQLSSFVSQPHKPRAVFAQLKYLRTMWSLSRVLPSLQLFMLKSINERQNEYDPIVGVAELEGSVTEKRF